MAKKDNEWIIGIDKFKLKKYFKKTWNKK